MSSCLTGFGASGVSRRVSYLQPSIGYFELAAVRMMDGATERVAADICFTPRGRAFIRWSNNPAGTFDTMRVVPEVEVTNTETNVLRKVFIPPNGVARLFL